MDCISLYDPAGRDRSFAQPDPGMPQIFRTHEHRVDIYGIRAAAGFAIFNRLDEHASDHARLGLRGQDRADNGTDLPTDVWSIEQAAEEADKLASDLPAGWLDSERAAWIAKFHRPRKAAA